MHTWTLYALISLFLVAAQPALGKKPVLRLQKDRVLATYAMSALHTGSFEKKMRSGLTQRLIYRISLVENPGGRTVATQFQYCAATYDLWDENWDIECTSHGTTRRVIATRYSMLLRHVAGITDFSITRNNQLANSRRYHLEIQVQLNPVSQKTLEKVKLWLRQSEKGSQFSGYVGSMLSLFVDRSVGGSDLNVTMRSGSVSGREIRGP